MFAIRFGGRIATEITRWFRFGIGGEFHLHIDRGDGRPIRLPPPIGVALVVALIEVAPRVL